ncbi:MAG: hypothetical protein HZB26_17630 [Candidatus Hydrogenedentes bacterium]|nr:hypothetical protein [Candidatus Hydrogenedentota bacterium]
MDAAAIGGDSAAHRETTTQLVAARLFAGLIVLVTAEVFSGASLRAGLWHPWTLLVTYWLYFAHFFFFTTLAVWTGRTSLASLYLWGVLYGLYESWITKVIWSGYDGAGSVALGRIGPFGYSEISMVFCYHPVASFIVPLAILSLISPTVRALFPSLAWLTGKSRTARAIQVYLTISFATTMAMNSGGFVNLLLNLAFVSFLLYAALRLGGPALSEPGRDAVVVFGRRGFVGLCVYLLLLYGLTYRFIRPEGLPSIPIQLLTFVLYALAIAGLVRHRREAPRTDTSVPVDGRERRIIVALGAALFGVALCLSVFAGTLALTLATAVHLALWPPLGLVLTLLAVAATK